VPPQDVVIKAMLTRFVDWATEHDDVIRGFNPWHFSTRVNNIHLQKLEWLGMEQLPQAYDYMQAVGRRIKTGPGASGGGQA